MLISSYIKKNKIDVCNQLLEKIRLIKKSKIFKQKIRDKITNIITLYQKWSNIVDTICQKLNIYNYNYIKDNTYEKII